MHLLVEAKNQLIMHQGYLDFKWVHVELIIDEVDENIPRDNLVVDVYRNIDNTENEVHDISIEKDDIEDRQRIRHHRRLK